MLAGKRKSELCGVAQTRKPLFQMGKDTISENLIKTISDSLEAHELVEASLLETYTVATNEATATISAVAHSEVVQVIGHTSTLYRWSKKDKLGLQYTRITVLDGAFDPTYSRHLQVAKQALKQLHMDEVWFMPSAATPLKQMQAVSFSDHATMVVLVIRPHWHMKLCALEHELEGISYSIRTVVSYTHL